MVNTSTVKLGNYFLNYLQNMNMTGIEQNSSMEFETTTLNGAKILMTKKAYIFLLILSSVNICQSAKNSRIKTVFQRTRVIGRKI